jgi:hypothetical protein
VSNAAIRCHARQCVCPVPSWELGEKRPPFMFVLFSFLVRPFKRLGAHREASAGDQFLAFKELALPPVLAVAAQVTRKSSTVFGEGPLHVVGRRRLRVRRVERIVGHHPLSVARASGCCQYTNAQGGPPTFRGSAAPEILLLTQPPHQPTDTPRPLVPPFRLAVPRVKVLVPVL